MSEQTSTPEVAAERRKGAAEMVDRITRRLLAEALHMEEECSHPPCVHAQGIRLAEDWARNEFCRYINGRRAEGSHDR